uniref:NADH-ubiquinone oxidoreductase chain 4L n=1 Tax=Zaptyx kanaganensis TaxID=1885700 RepID=A0A224ACE8_9EUPU|nr:NADH dehydrogenase subunit 4L [Zaptyx kanaganensis]
MIKLLYLSYMLLMILNIYLFTISTFFLSTLLSLEAMVLNMLIFLGVFSYNLTEGLNMYLFILTLSVCEASIGLTLLISLVKVQGNDLIKSNMSMFN